MSRDSAITGIVPRVETHVIPARIHGRYLLERPGDDIRSLALLVGFHGYGENASRHLDELRAVRRAAQEPWLVVAVDAMHRFYDRRNNEVVGSWMTREERELAIQNNLHYVGAVLTRISAEHGQLPLVCIGFSQGTAMAYRVAAAQHACVAVVALAGDLPSDVDPSRLRDQGTRVLIGRNAEDGWYTDEKLAADERRLADAGVTTEIAHLAGRHEWTDAFRTHAARFIGDILESRR